MTPHYDLKQQEKINGVLGAGLGGHKHFCHVSGGSSMFFQRDWGGGVVKTFAYHMKI